jgi:hypothetical protein
MSSGLWMPVGYSWRPAKLPKQFLCATWRMH